MTQLAQIKKAVAFINKKTKNFKPEIALITGSGLAGSIPPLEKEVKVPYVNRNQSTILYSDDYLFLPAEKEV